MDDNYQNAPLNTQVQESPDELNTRVVHVVQNAIHVAEDYQTAVVIPTMKERYLLYYSDKDYYKKLYPRLSKISTIVSTDIMDTIEWALSSLVRTFTSGDQVISVQGVSDEDEQKARVMQELIDFQLQRQNHFTTIIYNWIKDAFITGLGIVKCYWDREEQFIPHTEVLNQDALNQLKAVDGVQIIDIQPPDQYGDYTVTYTVPYYLKNAPKVENILVSELLYSPDAKTIDEADFVAQRKEVTMSYLRQMEKQGVYANVDKVKPATLTTTNNYTTADQDIKEAIGDDYETWMPEPDEARRKAIIYECYIKMDVDGDGILEDMIVTISGDTILRIERNYMGRHPFFTISPMSDPHRIWAKKSYAELVGEIQNLKTAIQRQVVANLSLSNDPKMILSPEAINMDDYNKGRNVIRKKAGFPMADVAMSMPVNQFSPATFTYLEYLEGQKEQRTGITRYNQGLDGNSLNKMLDINTPVMKFDGTWVRMGDIKDGDVLIGKDGQPTTVIKAHEIHYPKAAYDMTFSNKEVIKAGEEHLWTVHGYHLSRRTVTTQWIYNYMSTHKVKLFIDKAKPSDFNGDVELPIDPYILGVMLGDGCLHSTRFATMDKDILKRMRDWAEAQGGYLRESASQHSGRATNWDICGTPMRRVFRDLKLQRDCHKEELKDAVKHIPEIYFTASFNQRLELLRGLMDTDGCLHSGALTIFSQMEGQLVHDVDRLISSLGGSATWNKTDPGDKGFRSTCQHWNLTFSLSVNPFSCHYKADRWKKSNRMQDHVTIVSIVPTDKVLMRCLTVDAPDGQFCVGKYFTVTHNTASGINAILTQSNQRLDLIARLFAETGVYQLYRFLVSLNQKFVDQSTVIRLTNESLQINPEDLQGNFDLIVSAGLTVQSKQATAMGLQQLLSALYQSQAVGIPLATPKNYYNIFKAWAENIGIKNSAKFISDPAVIQQKAMMEMQMVQQVLAQLPPDLQQFFMENGFLPPQVVALLPPTIQMLVGGKLVAGMNNGQPPEQQGMGTPPNPNGGSGSMPNGGGGGMGGQRVMPNQGNVGLENNDNRVPNPLRPERDNFNQ